MAPRTETILLVEDDKYIRDLERRVLERAGFTVVAVSSGEEALDVYRSDKISLTILDLTLPRMSGEQCLKKILEISPDAKVLVMSGLHVTEDEMPGARGFITKPCIMNDVLRHVREILDTR